MKNEYVNMIFDIDQYVITLHILNSQRPLWFSCMYLVSKAEIEFCVSLEFRTSYYETDMTASNSFVYATFV